MPDSHGSRTALGVAWLRAAHQLIDEPPLILEDAAIVKLLGPSTADRVLASREAMQTPGSRALRSHVVLRSRYAEDRLQVAAGRGVRQYLVLGAGYDTFMLRQPAWSAGLRVLEIDRPETQAEKRARIAAAGIEVPSNAGFVPIDFEKESLEDGLRRHGVRLDVPTFVSWLGVTMYLTEPAIDAVLRTVAALPAGSEIVFTFAQPPDSAAAGPTLAERAAAVGEPWLTYFEPAALERKLRGFGYAQVEFLTPEAAARYFAGRSDGLPAPRRTSTVSALL